MGTNCGSRNKNALTFHLIQASTDNHIHLKKKQKNKIGGLYLNLFLYFVFHLKRPLKNNRRKTMYTNAGITVRKHIVSRVYSYYPIGDHCYPNLTKNMKTYIMFKQHKIRLQIIKQIEPQQKYRRGTISNVKLLEGLNRVYRP